MTTMLKLLRVRQRWICLDRAQGLPIHLWKLGVSTRMNLVQKFQRKEERRAEKEVKQEVVKLNRAHHVALGLHAAIEKKYLRNYITVNVGCEFCIHVSIIKLDAAAVLEF